MGGIRRKTSGQRCLRLGHGHKRIGKQSDLGIYHAYGQSTSYGSQEMNYERIAMTSHTMSIRDRAIRLISRIQSAHIAQIRERRENHRQHISIASKLRLVDSSNEIDALTRDVSSEGLGMITTQRIEEGTLAEIELSLPNCTESIFAKCCWCTESGCFYISGWKFVKEPASLENGTFG